MSHGSNSPSRNSQRDSSPVRGTDKGKSQPRKLLSTHKKLMVLRDTLTDLDRYPTVDDFRTRAVRYFGDKVKDYNWDFKPVSTPSCASNDLYTPIQQKDSLTFHKVVYEYTAEMGIY